MSIKEVNRLEILKQVKSKQITQVKAAELLGISDRQVRNLLQALDNLGAEGLISKKRGVPSNRQYNDSKKQKILKLMSSKYQDFGPTLTVEKLYEEEGIKVSRETARKWMIDRHWHVPKVKKRKIHLLRQRKAYFGEMLQGDGSHHDWFGNGAPCALVYFIDDATGVITAARFEEGESLAGYAKILKEHLELYGVPWSIYTDRFSVFETARKKGNLTQFRRMLSSLNVKWIGANSPQAKGRIERFNRTLQDRLVKELRLRKIKNIEDGNEFLREYLPKFNEKFSKRAAKDTDLHRPLDGTLDISRTLARYEERTTRNDLTFQFQNVHYKILESQICEKKIEIRLDWEGKMRIFQRDKELKFISMDKIFEEEKIQLIWKEKVKRSPHRRHPWKDPSYLARLNRRTSKMSN
jgi:hypothetical protein